MYYNYSSFLSLDVLLFSYYLTHSFPQLLLVSCLNLWKSILNGIKNALINILSFFISFLNVLIKGKDYKGFNVSFGSDLSERIITRTRYNYKTLGVIILE